jgi:hypothetical protein
MGWLPWVGVFCFGFIAGYLIRMVAQNSVRKYNGTIVVNRNKLTEKIVYSLILDDYPEELRFKKMVIFKVDNTEESSDRD